MPPTSPYPPACRGSRYGITLWVKTTARQVAFDTRMEHERTCVVKKTGDNQWLILCAMYIGSAAAADGLDLDREWRVGDEDRCKGVLVAANDKSIKLKLPNGNTRDIRIEHLSEKDRTFVDAVSKCEASAEVYSIIQPQIDAFTIDPMRTREATAVFLSRQETKKDFAAAFYAGTVNAFVGKPSFLEDAKRQLKRATSRILEVQSVAKQSHATTLASAYNNQAVIAIRQRDVSEAVTLLCKAAESADDLPAAVIHNAKLLLAGELVGKVRKTDEKRLASVIAKQAAHVLQGFPPRPCYSFIHDPFKPLLGEPPPEENLPPLEWLPDNTCFKCSGTAKIDCPQCNNGAIPAVRMVPAVVDPLHPPVMVRQHFKSACGACGGRGWFVCPDCNDGVAMPLP